MIKNLLFIVVFISLGLITYGQTIVSTSPQNQNVVLEEFTGIHCGACPYGHLDSQAIQDAYPDRVSLIFIHVGSFADPHYGGPDYRTQYGEAIKNQSYSGTGFGYPSGTVNRHLFPGRSMASGGGAAMIRDNWAISADETLAIGSVVNVAVEASFDISTQVLTVHVEGYYTGNSPEATNLLNVALLQNNTAGPQGGGGVGNNYLHMHRLIEMITGQWGEVINTTTTGTFVDRTFTYPIPTDYNGVPAELADLEIVAYIANTHQEIPSGNRAYPTYSALTNANDANIRYIPPILHSCPNIVFPTVNIQNLGQDPISSLAIEYIVNGDSFTYNWTGNILSLKSETIELPEVPFNNQVTNTVEIKVPDDDNNANNYVSAVFNQPSGTGTVHLELQVDNNGSETRWFLYDSNGIPIYHGGPYPDNQPQIVNETFLLQEGCYEFYVWDIQGDGGGEITLRDNQGVQLFYTNGDYGDKQRSPFSSNGVLGVNQNQLENISLYPNPATSTINLKNAENANIQVYDLLGKMIISMDNISMDEQIDVAKLQTGTYFMKISKDNYVTTKRFLVSK